MWVTLNHEPVESEFGGRSASVFNEPQSNTITHEVRIDEQVAQFDFAIGEVFQRIKSGQLAARIENVHPIFGDHRSRDAQLLTAGIHELRRVTPVRFRSKRQIAEAPRFTH